MKVPEAILGGGGGASVPGPRLPDFPAEDADSPGLKRRHWVLAALLALLFHILLLFPKIPGLLSSFTSISHPRVDIHEVDPKKLEAIRRQWHEREKHMLLDRNLNVPTSKEAPKDARYFSDRNMKVDKEQRAKQTVVVPKAGHIGEHSAPAQPKTEPVHPSRILPNLGNLGVRLPEAPRKILPPRQEVAGQHQDGTRVNDGDEAGSQYIDDRTLPEGSENMLNAEESVYYSFYARISDAVGPVWQSKVRALLRSKTYTEGEYRTFVDVVLDKDGNLVDARVMQSSQKDEFDHEAQDCWHTVGRFPNPPEGLLNPQGEVHIGYTFIITLQPGGPIQIAPPARVY